MGIKIAVSNTGPIIHLSEIGCFHCLRFLEKQGIEPLFVHPYYPQDKGKTERMIRNIAEEFVNLQSYAPLREQEIPAMAGWADKGI